MSRSIRPKFLAAVVAVAALAAPSAALAQTSTPLGKCTPPKPPTPNLERLNVPAVVKVGSDGRPSGASVGLSVRNFTEPYQGSGVDTYVWIIDAASGRTVGQLGAFGFGCVRYLWSMREAIGFPLGSGPMQLRRGRLYVVRSSAGFIDWPVYDPLGPLRELTFPAAAFVTV